MSLASLAVDSANVYVAADAVGIIAVPKNGGLRRTLVNRVATTIAVDQTNLYWSGQGGIKSVPLAGGQPTLRAPTQNYVTSLLVDAVALYWVEALSIIKRVGLAGGQPTTLATVPVTSASLGYPSPSALQATSITVQGSFVYWVSPTGIERMSTVTGQVATIGSLPTTAFGPLARADLVSDGTTLLLSTGTEVFKMPLGGGPWTLVGHKSLLGGFAADSANVYMADRGAIVATSLSSGQSKTETVARDPTAIAIDATSLYYVDHPQNDTWRVVKVTPK
jgi:hypothetical protein